jgi:uncharacterized small protein (TIGR04563 family)
MKDKRAAQPTGAARTGCGMAGSDKRKQSLYFPESMLQEIQHEAARLDRSLSWIVQRCVKLGLDEIRRLPSVNDLDEPAGDDARGRDED